MARYLTGRKILRGIISAVLLAYLVSLIEWNRLFEVLQNVKPQLMIWGPILLLSGFMAAAGRWHILLSIFKIDKPLSTLFGYYLIGSFYNSFLPGVIGGDIIRIGICRQTTEKSVTVITASVLAERILGVIALFMVGSLFVFNLSPEIVSNLGKPIIWGILIVAAIFLVILILFLRLGTSISCFLKEKFKRKYLIQIGNVIGMLSRLSGVTVLRLLLLSVLFQSADILATFVIAKALNISVTLPFLFALMPIVYVVTILPISLGGLGMREGIFVYLLSQNDIVVSDAIALSFLIYINRLFIGTFGSVLQILWKEAGAKT